MQEKEQKINKIRIAFVITQSEIGGAQQFLAQLISGLDHRFEPIVIVGSDGRDQLQRILPPSVQYLVATTLHRNPSPFSDIASLFQLRSLFKQLKPDILFLNSSKAGFNGSWAASALPNRLPGIRVIYRIGGWTFNDPWPAWKKWFYLTLERLSAHWKDIIIVNNSHDLEQARQLGIRPKQGLIRIFNGIDPYQEYLSRQEARAALDQRIPESYRPVPYDHLIGTIANLYPAKDLKTLVQAAAHLPESTRFLVIGEGLERASLEKLISHEGLERRFFLVGSIPDARKYLPAFDVFALSSVKEGFPWSVLEAMAAKIPVVATSIGAVPEMIADHVSGLLVPTQQSTDLAVAIKELLNDDHLRQSLAIAAHQEVMNRFSLRSMITQYESVFSSLRS